MAYEGVVVIVSRVSVEHVTLNFARSGGPGGQNVNKGMLSSLLFLVVSFLRCSLSSSFNSFFFVQ